MVATGIHHLLVGIDDGDLAQEALEVAMELAVLFDARIELAHAVDVHPLLRGRGRAPEWAAAADTQLAEARAKIEGRLSLAIEHPRLADLPVDDYLTVHAGRPASVLLELALEKQTDLLVLGRHRNRKLIDFGGTTRAVLSQSPCPVWLQTGALRPIHRILAAIDASDATEPVLACARTLAGAFDARVEVLHCFLPLGLVDDVALQPPTSADILEAVRDADRMEFRRRYDAFDWGDIHAAPLLVEGEPAEEILARQRDFDLIVMGTHGRTGLARALLGSQSYKVLKHAERAVVAVHHG